MISNNTISRDFLGDFPILLDGKPVEKITAFLFPNGGNNDPQTLIANAGKSFVGSYVLGMGFTFDDTNENATSLARMNELIEKDSRNADRIFPYIGGEEVNSSPTHSYHRYVINFGTLSEDEACRWPDLMAIVEEKVKPKRLTQGSIVNPERWWIFARPASDLQRAIEGADRVLFHANVSPHLAFAFLPSNMVYAAPHNVFTLSEFSHFVPLQSRIHEIWARFFGSSMKDDLRYTPSDCFETFPFPENWETDETLESIGKTYYEFRAALMVQNNQGLTATYNRFHDPEEIDPDILKLRELHSAMDRAVLNAYGWPDIDTTCEFRLDYEDEDPLSPNPSPTSGEGNRNLLPPSPPVREGLGMRGMSKRKKPWRYRWPEATHDEVLARLLILNQQRYDHEALMGKSKATKGKTKKSPSKVPKNTKQLNLIQPAAEQLDLL